MTESEVQIVNDHPTLRIDEDRIRKIVDHILHVESFSVHYLTIVFSDRDTIHELNRTYLQHDYPTDVLSFPLRRESEILSSRQLDGEIYIDLDMAMERAPEFDTTFELEVARYAIHGLLHLCGFDDKDPESKSHMISVEERYLAKY